MVSNLSSQFSISTFFPVQSHVIPSILKTINSFSSSSSLVASGILSSLKSDLIGCSGEGAGGDICVSAPTGSGKTLAYAVPIINAILEHRALGGARRLKCLIIVPNRDLAIQVKAVFQGLTKGSNVKTAIAVGQTSFKQDQKKLLDLKLIQKNAKNSQTNNHSYESQKSFFKNNIESTSLCDILIATPGRLVDLLTTPPFLSLSDLNFLVLDEADRLLMQSYQDWLNKVLIASNSNRPTSTKQRVTHEEMNLTENTEKKTRVCKFLFSATLTHNPSKIAELNLYNPVFFTSVAGNKGQLYKVPESLQENIMVYKNLSEKPLALYYLLTRSRTNNNNNDEFGNKILIFTSSLETTHRLYLLLKILGAENVEEFSSNLSQNQRHKIISKFNSTNETEQQNTIQRIVIASDAMARGLDIDQVDTVINYDMPTKIKTYIHRIGRTARGGKEGKTFTLVRKEEMPRLEEVMDKAERGNSGEGKQIKRERVDKDDLKQMMDKYKEALETLEEEVKKNEGKRKGQKEKEKKRNIEEMGEEELMEKIKRQVDMNWKEKENEKEKEEKVKEKVFEKVEEEEEEEDEKGAGDESDQDE